MVRSLKKTKNVDFALFILDTYHDYKRLGKKKDKTKRRKTYNHRRSRLILHPMLFLQDSQNISV